MHEPKSIDTSDIKFPQELLDLTEKIVENVHENWALGRIKEGWAYGETRNDEFKTAPGLVPYSELTVSEKYGRTTAL